jgi:hypothetical protein
MFSVLVDAELQWYVAEYVSVMSVSAGPLSLATLTDPPFDSHRPLGSSSLEVLQNALQS